MNSEVIMLFVSTMVYSWTKLPNHFSLLWDSHRSCNKWSSK